MAHYICSNGIRDGRQTKSLGDEQTGRDSGPRRPIPSTVAANLGSANRGKLYSPVWEGLEPCDPGFLVFYLLFHIFSTRSAPRSALHLSPLPRIPTLDWVPPTSLDQAHVVVSLARVDPHP